MKNTEDALYIARLIVKSFQQELSETESDELRIWLSDPQHQKLYESLRDRNPEERRQIIRQLHPREKWEQLEKQIPFRPASRFLLFARYAAAILLAAAFIGLFYLNRAPETQYAGRTSGEEKIHPGNAKAFLILDNGETIKLTDAQQIIPGKDSTIKLNNQDNTLSVTVAPATLGESSCQTLYIPVGGEYKLILADGSKVWLNSDSRLKFPASFTGSERTVYLEGEAYFEVAHNAKQPFIVSTAEVDIEVLGTKFNIKAYNEDPVVCTTLAEGAVRTTGTKTNTSLLLSPDEQSRYSKATGQFRKQPVDARIFTGWREGKFIFENETLEEVMKQLCRWYDTQVIYRSPEMKDYRFTGYVNRFAEISTILRMIEKTYNITFTIQGNIITVNQK